jgi:hypothetical protein
MPGLSTAHSPSDPARAPSARRRRATLRRGRQALRSLRGRARVALAASAVVGFATLAAAGAGAGTGADAPAGAAPPPFLSQFHHVVNLGTTVPTVNGDENPYGVVQVPQSEGKLIAGDTLVSNFNDNMNSQGTGTTIVEMSPQGVQSLFAQIDPNNLPGPCPGGVGLTTALTIVGEGYVVVGSLPVTDGGNGSPMPGCLIVLNNEGVPVETIAGHGLDGPWDLTAAHYGYVDELFVTNVLNDNTSDTKPAPDGTVVRLDLFDYGEQPPILVGATTIATGFDEELNSMALVLGPTGDALGANDTLYVADTVKSRIAAIPDASTRNFPAGGGGLTLSEGGSLNGPLGMVLAPNGDIITVNGNDPNAVETTPFGNQVDTVQLDPLDNSGDLFGVTIPRDGNSILFVDDGDNTLKRFVP